MNKNVFLVAACLGFQIWNEYILVVLPAVSKTRMYQQIVSYLHSVQSHEKVDSSYSAIKPVSLTIIFLSKWRDLINNSTYLGGDSLVGK